MSDSNDGADERTLAAVQALSRLSRFMERSATELSLADFRVLSAINSGEERASRVAARLSIGRPSISATVDSLCRRGLLVRGAVHHDQRADSLRLTEEGIAVRARVERALATAVEGLCARTSDPQGVIAALAELEEAVEGAMRERDARRPVPSPGTEPALGDGRGGRA